jgi:hypothetical protein
MIVYFFKSSSGQLTFVSDYDLRSWQRLLYLSNKNSCRCRMRTHIGNARSLIALRDKEQITSVNELLQQLQAVE